MNVSLWYYALRSDGSIKRLNAEQGSALFRRLPDAVMSVAEDPELHRDPMGLLLATIEVYRQGRSLYQSMHSFHLEAIALGPDAKGNPVTMPTDEDLKVLADEIARRARADSNERIVTFLKMHVARDSTPGFVYPALMYADYMRLPFSNSERIPAHWDFSNGTLYDRPLPNRAFHGLDPQPHTPRRGPRL